MVVCYERLQMLLANAAPMTADRNAATATLVIGNSIAEMARVVEFVDRFGSAHKIPKPVSDDINLCLDELLNNTISYGYSDQAPHRISLELALEDGRFTARITDDGKPFDPRGAASAPSADDLRSRRLGGVGVHFVRALMDELGYSRDGTFNIVTIAKKFRVESNGDR
jgi:anti-sigma regulatory factor (Ser/Thr protein kinase)